MKEENIFVEGALTDNHTRCVHYRLPEDIIAIKFKCCDTYYACIHCHEEYAGHIAERWKIAERKNKAVLCGNCKKEMIIETYLKSNSACPFCKSAFNPKCVNHHHFYFEQDQPVP